MILMAACIAATPMYAEAITWTLDDATATSNTSTGITLSDGTVVSGTFGYACSTTYLGGLGTCDDVGNVNPSTGTFTANNISVNVTNSTFLSTVAGISNSTVWYLNPSGTGDCCSDGQTLDLVDYNPATSDGLTGGTGGAPGYLLALSWQNDPQIGVTSGGLDDNGGLYTFSQGTPPLSGYCNNAECSQVDTSNGPYGNMGISVSDVTAHVWANAYVAPPPSSTPEPETMMLAGSALVGLGLLRRKLVRK